MSYDREEVKRIENALGEIQSDINGLHSRKSEDERSENEQRQYEAIEEAYRGIDKVLNALEDAAEYAE